MEFTWNETQENCGKHFPMNVTGHLKKKIDIDYFYFLGVMCRFSINITTEVHCSSLHWEMKRHGSHVNLVQRILQSLKIGVKKHYIA